MLAGIHTVRGSGSGRSREILAGLEQASESQRLGPRIPVGHHPVLNPDVGRAPPHPDRRPARGIP